MKRRQGVISFVILSLVAVVLLSACTAPSGSSGGQGGAEKPAPIRIGVLPTEDSLPLWVAEQDGAFKQAGLDVTLENFQSAQERDAALAAGGIDAFMGDIIAAAQLTAGGQPVKIATIMLGATPQQGRFGIVSAPGSGISTVKQLANVPIGTSSATIQEYVLDGLMTQGGVPADQIKKEEVKKVPVRFELLMAGKLKAAALPEPFLSLAVKQGATLVADDTKGQNLSQTVLAVSDKYLQEPAGDKTVTELLNVWDAAVAKINANPSAYRGLLVEKARLPQPLAADYPVNQYPKAQLPTQAEVDAVLAWMKQKGYLKADVTYDNLVWIK